MTESTFFESGDVKITNARFIVGGKTYAMQGVTSVSARVQNPNRIGPIVGLVIGLAMLGSDLRGVGFVICLACAAMLYLQKAVHSIILQSASGEVQALSSKDGAHIGAVVAALNDALVHRG